MLQHPILWALDNEIDSRQFERLCTDLLFRNGYVDIAPVGGTNDAGRDAEIRHFRGNLPGGSAALFFFQYSLEKKWKAKLQKELKKVLDNRHDIQTFVFVTSRQVRGDQQDVLRAQVKAEYGWNLIIHEREWLRLQLEEAHPDLAEKYLGIVGAPRSALTIVDKPTLRVNDAEHGAWRLFETGDFDAAAVAFKQWLMSHGQDKRAWNALAWCQYQLTRYGEALSAINQALALDPEDTSSLVIKGSILTEDGISRSSRAVLITARDIFNRVAHAHSEWVNHYNYANALSALGQFDEAREQYAKALELDPNQAVVWKNLSYVMSRLGDADEEIRCLDRALELDPKNSEALVSKGIRLLHEPTGLQEALQLLERALTLDSSITQRWPHFYYWLTSAYQKCGKPLTALQWADNGLAATPHHLGLVRLKGEILSSLWRADRSHLPTARLFFLFQHEAVPEDGPATVELALIHHESGDDEAAWRLVDGFFGPPNSPPASRCLRIVGCTLKDVLASVRFLDAYWSFRRNYGHRSLLDVQSSGGFAANDYIGFELPVILSVPFGLGCQALMQIPRASRDACAGEQLYDVLTQQLGRLIPRSSELLIPQVRRDPLEALSTDLASIIVGCREIALFEVSWQMGYIAGIMGIPPAEVENTCPQGDKLNTWLAGITSDALFQLNRTLKFAPV